jgi:hypothetical protein
MSEPKRNTIGAFWTYVTQRLSNPLFFKALHAHITFISSEVAILLYASKIQSNKHKNVQHAHALQAPVIAGTIVARKQNDTKNHYS